MKPLEEVEKRFNKLANDYGRKAYTKEEFDKNEDLQKALKSFAFSETYVLQDDLSNIFELQDYHHTFLENKDDYINDINLLQDSETIEYTQKLFKITNKPTAKKIASEEYFEIYTMGFITYRDKNGEQIEDTEIADKIEKFHNFCINVDNSKKFIKKHFPRWEKFTKEKKKEAQKELKELIDHLEILRIDTKALKVTYYFITKYERLNQDVKFKADILLYFKLPNINTLSIAKEIVDFSAL